jgi:beta-glucosidase
LLKNQDALLPLDTKSRIALIGALAKEIRYQGGGSSWVNPAHLVNALEGFNIKELDYTYYQGYSLDNRQDDRLLSEAITGAKDSDISVIIAGLPPAYESEGFDRATMQLPEGQNELIRRVSQVNPNTLVVLLGGAPVEMPWLSNVKAVLHMHLPGQAGGLAIAQLLTGAVNPSGKLAESYPFSYADVPSAGFYEEAEIQAQYREGIYVGYRYYETAKKEVCFPFGHGLSYTTFGYTGLELSQDELQEGEHLNLSVTVKNTGDVDGAEVVQLYVSSLEQAVFRPQKELKDFAKVFLHAGEACQVDFQLDPRSFAVYDVEARAWVIPEGTYRISIGASSRDIRLSRDVIIRGKRLQKDSASQAAWYTSLQGKPTQADFEALLGRPIEPHHKPQKGGYTLNSSFREMQKSLPIRIMLWTIERAVAKGFGGVDYSNPNFRGIIEITSTNPLKSMVTASGGLFGLNIAQGLVDMANGHFIKGLRSFLRKKK